MANKNIYILGGQSNAQGATGEAYDPTNTAIPNWEIFNFGGTAIAPLSDLNNLGSAAGFSVEMPFADLMNQEGESGIFLKVHQTGRPIADDDSQTDMNFATGELFNSIRGAIANAKAFIEGQGDTPVFKGLLWIHGEADSTRSEWAGLYARNMKEFVTMVRKTTGEDRLPVISLLTDKRINPHYQYVDVVRSQMNFLSASDPDFYTIDSRGNNFVDGVHYDSDSMKRIGEQYVNFFLQKRTFNDGDNIFSKIEVGSAQMPFQNSWVNFDAGYEPMEVMRTEEGMVTITGAIKSGTIPNTIATLPVLYRPTGRLRFRTMAASGTEAQIEIRADGQVVPLSGDTGFTSLSGITFLSKQ